MGTWIDFKQLREQLDFGEMLKRYGVPLKAAAGEQYKGRCPLPSHPKPDNGSLCFSASLKKKIWRCFGCGASGNVLDFAVCMEGGSPKTPADVRRVALVLQERFGAPARKQNGGPVAAPRKTSAPSVPHDEDAEPLGQTLVNAPLDFHLKNLSTDHPFFRRRRLLRPTIEHFGLGFCTKGLIAGRIAIPLNDLNGKLVGYVGRLPDEIEETEEQPAYLWPNDRVRNGVKLTFDRLLLLYHADRLARGLTDLYVVQSPESAWWLWQAGFRDVVAIMGDNPSLQQRQAIVERVRPTGRIWLLTDGNKLGERCVEALFFGLGQTRFCRWVRLPDGTPVNYEAADLQKMLAWKP